MHRLLLALAAVAGIMGLTSSDGGTWAHASSPVSAPSAISWSDCTPRGYQCAKINVPVDYSKPSGGTLELSLIRLPARDPARRIGSLLANPGGPGGSAIDFMKGWPAALSSDIRARFDLVAFDPRGVGESTPIVCHDTLQKLVAIDPSPDSDTEWRQAQDAARRFAEDCASRYRSLLPFVGTKNVARDMESIRVALGEDQLTYVGYSYGTAIGAVYADMYPSRVRAFVLDGALDLSQGFEDINRLQMIGFERAYQAYLADCKQKSCPLATNGDPAAAVDKLLAGVEQQPLAAPRADRPSGPGETLLGIISALYSSRRWGALTSALRDAEDGDGSGLVELSDDYLQRNPDGSYPNLIEANAAVNYVDEACPKDPNAYISMADRLARAAPHFGASAASAGLLCAFWPVTADPLTTPRAAGAPPIVVISTTNDPATPYEWGVAMARQLESGALITNRGEGHTIYAQGVSCVDQAVNAYLLNLTVPEAGKTCGNGPPPPETAATPTPGATASPPAAQSPATTATRPRAPGPPNTGASQKGDGSSRVGLVAAAFVLLAVAAAAIVVLVQRRR